MLHRANHLDIRVMLNDRTQLGFMPGSAQIIEYHTGNINLRIERLIAQNQRCYTSRHAARINYQNDGRAQQFGQRGITIATVEIKPVIQAFISLDQANTGIAGCMVELLLNFRTGHHVKIKVIAGALSRHSQP